MTMRAITYILIFIYSLSMCVPQARAGSTVYPCKAADQTAAPGVVACDTKAAEFNKEAFIASANKKKALQIKMVDCIAMALKNNSEIQIKRIDPLKADSEVRIQKGVFDPQLSFTYLKEDDKYQDPSTLDETDTLHTKTDIYSGGYSQKLVTGTEVGVEAGTIRTDSNSAIMAVNPSYNSGFDVVITQPLLKGAGIIVNKAFFLIAKNNSLIATQDLTKELITVLSDVKKSYYDFQYAQEQYKVAVTALERVKNLHEINKERYNKGLASNVDILQSESEVARFEEATYAAERVMKSAEDNLKFITNLVNDPELWNADIILLDTPSYEKQATDLKNSIITAFDYRPDYEAAKIDLQNRDISVVYYKNGLLPTVDMIGSYGLNGLHRKFNKSVDYVKSGDYPDWAVGVSVSVPLWRDKEKGEYDKSKLEKEQALIGFKRLEQKIILEVRDAVRDIDIRFKTVDASLKSKNAEEENYKAQESRFSSGLVSTLDMLIYQERLARAQLSYAKGVIDYNLAIVQLAKAQGTMLDDDNILMID